MLKKLIIGLFFLTCSNIFAGLFQIINRTGTCSTACTLLENEVNANLPQADASTYLKGMANAAVMSQKGVGADYASNIEYMSIGWAAGVGAMLADGQSDTLGSNVDLDNLEGVGASSGVVLGLNGSLFTSKFGSVDASRFNFYLHYLTIDAPDRDGLLGNSTSSGLEIQYKIIPLNEAVLGAFSWGGIDFTTGFLLSKMNLKFVKTIQKSQTNLGVTASFNGTATVGAKVSTYTIPLELSTNVRLFYVISMYLGIASDLSFGSAESLTSITGPIIVSGGGTGDASLNLGQEEGPSFFSFRSFLGMQVNLTALRVFAQVTKGISRDSYGLTLGARVAF